jgi:NAD(P)-dependent dehydrogenase (short-subunit alcohol dehydrogenase family)
VACLSRSGALPDAPALDDGDARRLASLHCDVTDFASIERAFRAIPDLFGTPIVGLVNNAGIHLQGPSATFPLADFEHVMRANASSVLMSSQAAYPYLRRSQHTLVVNIGSFYDKLGVRGNAAYCASKAAVAALSRCLAVEWARDGIRVLNVAPGYVETDLNRDVLNEGPLRRFLEKRIPAGTHGRPADVGCLVAMLYRLPAHFLTGETLYVDGGQGIAL